MNSIELRGYAIPFNTIIAINDGYERVLPGAFTTMLNTVTEQNIDVRFGAHDDFAPQMGTTKAGDIKLFADSFGLGFSVRVDMKLWECLAAITRRSCPSDQCSVNLFIEATNNGTHLGEPLTTITKASIDHIAIVSSAAYGKATGVWPTHCVDHSLAPSRIQTMAAQWDAGSRRWSEVQAQRKRERALEAKRNTPGYVPPALAARMVPRQEDFAAMRRAVVAARTSMILGHVAWTRAGGFEGAGG